MYMFQCQIQFYDYILKLSHNGQGHIHTFLVLTTNFKANANLVSSFQLFYNFEGKHMNNYNLMVQF